MMRYEEMTDVQLLDYIKSNQSSLEYFERCVANHRRFVHEAQAELTARKLEAHWLANPRLTRVKAGDELMATDEFLSIPYCQFSKGESVFIREIYDLGGQWGGWYGWVARRLEISFDDPSPNNNDVPLEMLIRMRVAFLDAQKGKHP